MIDMMRDVLHGGTASSVPRYLTFSADWAGKNRHIARQARFVVYRRQSERHVRRLDRL